MCDKILLLDVDESPYELLRKKGYTLYHCHTEEEIQKLCDIIIRLSSRRQKFVYKERSNPDSSINIIDNCFAYLMVNNIKSAGYKDFIEGILNNRNLSISEFDTSMLSIPEEFEERAKIIKLEKNNLR